MISILFISVLTTSWLVTVVILFVLLLRKVMGAKMGTKFRQVLWGIILLRLLLPVVPESPMSIMNWLPSPQQLTQKVVSEIKGDAISYSSQNQEDSQIQKQILQEKVQTKPMFSKLHNFIPGDNVEVQGEIVRYSTSSPIIKILVIAWGIGAFLFLGFCTFTLVKFHRTNSKKEQDVKPELIEELLNSKQLLKLKKNISLKQLPGLNSPLLTGIFYPKIYVPEELMSRTSTEERVNILLHELVHWKRRDILWNFILLFALSIHWFNPIIWIASQKMKEDREMSCDAAVLAVLGEDKAISYGNVILQVVKFQNGRLKGLLYQTAFFGNKNQTKRRIMMINKYRFGKSNKITITALLLCIILSGATLTDATSYATKNEAEDINNKVTTFDSANPNATPAKFQLYDPSYQYFDELESFYRYTDFPFQLPNYLPKPFEVNDYRIHREEEQKNKSIIDIDYWYNTMGGAMVEGAVEEHFRLSISEDNLLEKMVPKLTEKQKKESHFTYHYETKPKTVAGVSGIQLTDWRKHKEGYSLEEDNHYQGERTEYFIWQKDNVWYAMEYLCEMTAENKSYYLLNLSSQEVERVISSFTDPTKITHSGYYKKHEMPSFAVYDQYDLKRITKDWGISPKLPMELPGLKASSASMRHVFYDNKEFGVFHIKYVSNKNPSGNSIAEYEQATLPAEYNNVEKMYQEQQKKTLKANESAFILQRIQGKKVYALEEKNKTTQRVHYYWDNGFFSIDGKLGEHTEILKILLNNPT